MALATYSDLKTAITSWLDIKTTDLTSQIDDLVTLGEHRLFRETRTRDMEASLNSTMTANGVIPLPTSYTEMKFAYINTTPVTQLERRTAEWIYSQYPSRVADRRPKFFARDTTNIIFGPFPDSAYLVSGVYYQRLAALSGSVNALFSASPDLYLFACLAESEVLIGRDERIQIWEAKYQKILSGVNAEDDNEDHSGSALRVMVA